MTTLAAFALGRLAVKAVRDVELERAHAPDRDRAVAPAPVSAPERDRPADRDRDQAHDWIPSEAREQPTARPAESGQPRGTGHDLDATARGGVPDHGDANA